ncbi:MAG: RluA family pseudouridine synthase [Rickettsiaceae bacterium]
MSIETIIVKSTEPVRLDRYLKRLYPSITQGIIESYVRKGKIKVNKKKAKSSDRVKVQDEITISKGILDGYKVYSDNTNFSESVVILSKKILSDYLLFASKELIAINKPSGLAVQGGSKISLSIDDALAYLNQTRQADYKLVHRLDKETSGILIIATGHDSAIRLGKAFKDKLIKKTYIALLCGKPSANEGVISNIIGKEKSGAYEVVREQESGKYAETFYKVLDNNHQFSLVEFKPTTGRTHQLRVHSKILGCPIVGDKKYGGVDYSRMLLHAKELMIPAEVFGHKVSISSKLPEEFSLDLRL